MGDRIAVLKQGRATSSSTRRPPSCSPTRPTSSSSSSSAPTARSSAWRCSACATSTCGRSRSSSRATPSPSCAPSGGLRPARPRALVDDDGRPSAGCASATFSGERVPRASRLARRAGASTSTTSCATRSGDLLDAESRYAPVVDAQGRMAGVLSMEVIAHALHLPAEQARSSTELVADRDDRRVAVLAQIQIRERTGDGLRRGERLLPGLDRRQPRQVLVAAARARLPDARVAGDRLRDRVRAGDARPPPALADRADHRRHRRALHRPERRGVLPAAADHRPRQPDGDRRAGRLHAADPVPQHHDRPAQRARRRRSTPRAAWA